MSVGRKPNTVGLNLDKIGVKLDSKGRVETDHKYKTNLDNIYAIGDVIVGPMLAHKAEEEGIAVAELLSGKFGHVNYDVIPGVVYTSPEVASVGKTGEQLKEQKKLIVIGAGYIGLEMGSVWLRLGSEVKFKIGRAHV